VKLGRASAKGGGMLSYVSQGVGYCTQVCISDDTRVDDGDMMGILRLR